MNYYQDGDVQRIMASVIGNKMEQWLQVFATQFNTQEKEIKILLPSPVSDTSSPLKMVKCQNENFVFGQI